MKTSVLMITYNQDDFVGQAIESALMQRTDSRYEIVIGEDCSTDRTREIVRAYQRRFPDQIRLLLPENNVGAHRNFEQTLRACRGQYIALLEGDDYWSSPHKLQKQIEVLDTQPGCAICFHAAKVVYENGEQESYTFIPPHRKTRYCLEDLVAANFMATCSVMFRNGLFEKLPDWFHDLPIGDWPLHILNAQHGDIAYIDQVMSVYRKHSSGMTTVRTPAETQRTYIDFYEKINAHLDFEYEPTIKRALARRWDLTMESLARAAYDQGSVDAARRSLEDTFAQWPANLPLPRKWKSKAVGRMYALFAFSGYKSGDLVLIRSCLPRAVGYDPSLLRNSGIWSIGLEAFLGHRMTAPLRRLARGSAKLAREGTEDAVLTH